MKRYLTDSGIASDYVNHRLGVRDRALELVMAGCHIGVPTVVLGELLGGIEWSQTADVNRDRLWHQMKKLRIWPFDKQAAIAYGRIYADLRRIGRPMQQIDIQVAAIAMALGNTTVVTKDSDLSAVPGLPVTNWAAERS